MKGWARQGTPVEVTFHFQISKFGFDRHSGGQFVVEFTARDPARNTSLWCRMWALLDDAGRAEFLAMNNRVIANLPGPSPEIAAYLGDDLRETYLQSFKPVQSMPAENADVWCRYASLRDAENWAEFVSARLGSLTAECERRLAGQDPATRSMSGHLFPS